MKAIRNRIDKMEEGSIFFTSDFNDIASLTTVRKCLSRIYEEGTIRRLFDGMYDKPRYSKLLKETAPPDIEKVSEALAEKYNWTIAPDGNISLNLLGLSTQVPMHYSYISDGPYREFMINDIEITFKHRANKNITNLSKPTIMVIEALRVLGKKRVNEDTVAILKNNLPNKEKKNILKEAEGCTRWIYNVIRRVCA